MNIFTSVTQSGQVIEINAFERQRYPGTLWTYGVGNPIVAFLLILFNVKILEISWYKI
jgi:hypothetical protein